MVPDSYDVANTGRVREWDGKTAGAGKEEYMCMIDVR